MPEIIPPDLLKFATPKELGIYKKLLVATKALETPLDYAISVTPETKPFAFTVYLNIILLALVEKRLYKSGPGPVGVWDGPRRVHPITGEPVLYRAMVSAPPQHGKSHLISGHFPAWALTKDPEKGIIFVTHTGDYAEKYGLMNREHIEMNPQFGIQVSDNSRAKDKWEVKGHRGYMLSVGVGSNRVTGSGGNVLIDDMIGGEEDANSPREREKVIDYWNARLSTRIRREHWCLYVGTRWHHGDFAGYIEKTEPEKWFIVNLPALAFDTTNDEGFSVDIDTGLKDPLNRRPGEALVPELHNEYELNERRKQNPGWFERLYQGRPTVAEGALFKTFLEYRLEGGQYHFQDERIAEGDCLRFGIVDTAVTTKNNSDYTVFGVFDMSPNRRMFVRHITRMRIPGDQLDSFITAQAKEWGCVWTGIEKAPNSETTIQRLQREGNIVVRPLFPGSRDKFTRAVDALQSVPDEAVLIPEYASWKQEFITELRQFDKGEHDDQVDVWSYAVRASKDIPVRKAPEVIKHTFDERLADAAKSEVQSRVKRIYNTLDYGDTGLW